MARVRFLDQVPVGVFQTTGGEGGTIDIYQNGILVSSSVPYINFTGSVQLSQFDSTGVTVYISGSGGGSGNGFPFSGSAVITGSLVISGSNPFVVFGLALDTAPVYITTYNPTTGIFKYVSTGSLVSGTSGTSGTSGSSGSSGTSGSSGSSGTSGISGSSGSSGTSGAAGSSGSSGTSGASGSSGSSGTSGDSGSSGSSGTSGIAGSSGSSGTSGIAGSSGSSGTSGDSGSSGSSGTSGSSGSSGISGSSGSSGTSGSSGSSGTSGIAGSSGSSGTSGDSGSSGSSGTSGIAGSSGSSGTSGITQSTGSLLTTASVSSNTITFTKGDGSTFPITVNTGSGSGGGTGIFVQSGSTDVYFTTSSLKITGSELLPAGASSITTTASQAANNYAIVVSQSGWFYNHNAGVPTSNAWGSGLNGSYFNNFTSNTDVSEILRFVSGLLSSSSPDASPNTKTYSTTLTENQLNTGTSTAPAGSVPSGSTNTDVIYLVAKGFAQTGSTLFSGKTIYSTSTFSSNYSSISAGSTTVSSSVNAQLFGLGALTSGGPTQFNVSGTINWFYSDNNLETSTATSQSENLLSQATFGSANGLTLAKINTANPTVIPAAYQDGLFANVYTSSLYNNGRSFSSVSSSGWYHISASIKIQSGSSPYSTPATDTTRIFYSPIASLTIPANTLAATSVGYAPTSATSRSLSGAPYLLTATWAISSSVTGLFNPLYASSATLADFSESDILVTLASTQISASTVGGTIQSTNVVFDSTGVTARAVNTIPFETDIVKLTGSATFNAGSGGAENINQTGLGTTTYSLLTRGTNKNSSQSTLATQTIPYFSASTFGQPLASGSMAYYGQPQGYDGGTLTGTTEVFSGETYRIQITNPLLSGSYANGTKFITASYDAYNLGALDLQVKPGFLVKPSGSTANGYWLANPSEAQTYKYYARAFQTNGNAFSTMTLNVGQTLTSWTGSANNAVSALIMFSSSVAGTAIPSGGGSTLTRAVLFDPSSLSSLSVATNQANDDFLNPFTVAIDIKGNNQGGSGLSGTTYSIPLTDTLNQILTSAYKDLIVMIRYNGQPTTPVSTITVGFS